MQIPRLAVKQPPQAALARCFDNLMVLAPPARAYAERLLSKPIELKARRKLVQAGRPAHGFFVVLAGWLAEYRQLRNGRRQILTFRLPGELIGLDCLLYSSSLNSADALTDCLVAHVSRAEFEEAQRDFPRLASAFLLAGLRDLALLQERAVNLGRRSAIQRVAHLLLELFGRVRLDSDDKPAELRFPLTQQEIADCTGLTAPYVNRVLQQLRSRGLIRMSTGKLEILDSAALKSAAIFSTAYLSCAPQTAWQKHAPSLGAIGMEGVPDDGTFWPAGPAGLEALLGRSRSQRQ